MTVASQAILPTIDALARLSADLWRLSVEQSDTTLAQDRTVVEGAEVGRIAVRDLFP